MHFFDLIKTRRSIRKFKNTPIEKEKVDRLIECALRSPSSRNIKPWRFIIIDNVDTIKKLSRAKPHGAGFLKGAPFCVVVCANTQESDVWVEDASIASVFIHLAAHEMGLGSCWIQIRKREFNASKSADTYVKDLLKIPDTMEVESIIAIGYPDEVKKAHEKESLETDKVSFHVYGSRNRWK